jgi:hypothetical protein
MQKNFLPNDSNRIIHLQIVGIKFLIILPSAVLTIKITVYNMSMPLRIGVFIINMVSSLTLLSPYFQFNHAILYENGTCTNGNLTKLPNQAINTNGSVGDFLKSLPSDNTILTGLVCQNTGNEPSVK